MVGSGRELETGDGLVEQFMICFRQGTVVLDITVVHLRIGFCLSLQLTLACGHHSFTDLLAGLGRLTVLSPQRFTRHARNIDMKVDAVEQRGGQSAAVASLLFW